MGRQGGKGALARCVRLPLAGDARVGHTRWMTAKKVSGPTITNEQRVRKLTTYTLSPEAVALVEARAEATGQHKSRIVDALILGAWWRP